MKNVGKIDKTIRIILAVIIGILYATKTIEGTVAYSAIAVAGVLLITGFINFCPLYKICGIKTKK